MEEEALRKKIQLDQEKSFLTLIEHSLYKGMLFSHIFHYLYQKEVECGGLNHGRGNEVTDITLLEEMDITSKQIIFPKPRRVYSKSTDSNAIGLWHYHGIYPSKPTGADMDTLVDEIYSNAKKEEVISRKKCDIQTTDDGKIRIPIKEDRFVELEVDGKVVGADDCYLSSRIIQYFWIFNKHLEHYGIRQEFEWAENEGGERYIPAGRDVVAVKIKDSFLRYNLEDVIRQVGETYVNGQILKTSRRFSMLLDLLSNDKNPEIMPILELEPTRFNSEKLKKEIAYLAQLKKSFTEALDPEVVKNLLQQFEQYKIQKQELMHDSTFTAEMNALTLFLQKNRESFERKADNLIGRYVKTANPAKCEHILREISDITKVLHGMNSEKAKEFSAKRAELEGIFPGKKIEFMLNQKRLYQFSKEDTQLIVDYLRKYEDASIHTLLLRKVRDIPSDRIMLGEIFSTCFCLTTLNKYIDSPEIADALSLASDIMETKTHFDAIPYWELDHAEEVLREWDVKGDAMAQITKEKRFKLSKYKQLLNGLVKDLRLKRKSKEDSRAMVKEVSEEFGEAIPQEIDELVKSARGLINEQV